MFLELIAFIYFIYIRVLVTREPSITLVGSSPKEGLARGAVYPPSV